MAGWHPQLNGYEFEHTLGDGRGQGSLECCCLWSCKELDTTEQLNNNKVTPKRFKVDTITQVAFDKILCGHSLWL